MTNFDVQNAKGLIGEDRIASICSERGWKVDRRFAAHKHDMIVTSPMAVDLLEVKNEDRYASSPDILVEFFQGFPHRPSGINTSESTVCIHTLGDRCVIYRTQSMRWFLHASIFLFNYPSANMKNSVDAKYEIIHFRGSDNENCGVKVSRLGLASKTWAQEMDTDKLTDSRIWGMYGKRALDDARMMERIDLRGKHHA